MNECSKTEYRREMIRQKYLQRRILEGDRCGQPYALSAMCLQSIAKVSTGAKRGKNKYSTRTHCEFPTLIKMDIRSLGSSKEPCTGTSSFSLSPIQTTVQRNLKLEPASSTAYPIPMCHDLHGQLKQNKRRIQHTRTRTHKYTIQKNQREPGSKFQYNKFQLTKEPALVDRCISIRHLGNPPAINSKDPHKR